MLSREEVSSDVKLVKLLCVCVIWLVIVVVDMKRRKTQPTMMMMLLFFRSTCPCCHQCTGEKQAMMMIFLQVNGVVQPINLSLFFLQPSRGGGAGNCDKDIFLQDVVDVTFLTNLSLCSRRCVEKESRMRIYVCCCCVSYYLPLLLSMQRRRMMQTTTMMSFTHWCCCCRTSFVAVKEEEKEAVMRMMFLRVDAVACLNDCSLFLLRPRWRRNRWATMTNMFFQEDIVCVTFLTYLSCFSRCGGGERGRWQQWMFLLLLLTNIALVAVGVEVEKEMGDNDKNILNEKVFGKRDVTMALVCLTTYMTFSCWCRQRKHPWWQGRWKACLEHTDMARDFCNTAQILVRYIFIDNYNDIGAHPYIPSHCRNWQSL